MRELSRWTLRRRINLGLAAILVIAVATGAATIYSSDHALRVLHQEQSSVLPASADAASLTAAMVDQETGVRGYLLTANAVYLQPYDSGRSSVRSLDTKLSSELAGHHQDLSRLNAVETAYRNWVTDSAEPTIALVRSDQLSVAASPANVAVGKTLFDAIRTHLTSLTSSLGSESSAAASQLATQQRQELEVAVLRSVVIVILVAGAGWVVRRWLLAPIDATAAQVRKVAGGDIDLQIQPSGPPEVYQLGGDVEAMRRRLRDELDEARTARESLAHEGVLTDLIRNELAPSPAPVVPGLDLWGRVLSAEGVLAGDWYDVVPLPDGKVVVVVADISGHGPAAGMFALNLKHLLLPVLHLGLDPGQALAWVDGQLDRSDEQFATAAVLELDPATGACRWASAGHPSALLIRRGRVQTLEPTGPILGPLGGDWGTRDLRLEPEDVVVLYTDGLPEARSAQGLPFGDDALARRAMAHAHSGAEELVEQLLSGVREHSGGPLADDATVVAVGVTAAYWALLNPERP